MEFDTFGRAFPTGEPGFPDETGRKKKLDKLLISGGIFGPQLMLFHSLGDYPEEKDPNP